MVTDASLITNDLRAREGELPDAFRNRIDTARTQVGAMETRLRTLAVSGNSDVRRLVSDSLDRLDRLDGQMGAMVQLSSSQIGANGAAAARGTVGRNTLGVVVSADGTTPTVLSVQTDSPAAKAGLQPGDQILSVNGQPIESYAQLVNELAVATDSGGKAALRVRRNQTVTADVSPSATAKKPGGPTQR